MATDANPSVVFSLCGPPASVVPAHPLPVSTRGCVAPSPAAVPRTVQEEPAARRGFALADPEQRVRSHESHRGPHHRAERSGQIARVGLRQRDSRIALRPYDAELGCHPGKLGVDRGERIGWMGNTRHERGKRRVESFAKAYGPAEHSIGGAGILGLHVYQTPGIR